MEQNNWWKNPKKRKPNHGCLQKLEQLAKECTELRGE